MKKRRIFTKKGFFNKKKYVFVFIFILVFFILIITNTNHFIIIEEFTDNYYIIPFDKEGIKIPNRDKQILHLNSNNDKNILIRNDLIKYSIQFYASIYYEEVKEKLDFYLQKDIFNKNDFSIIVLKHSIGQEYILIYKNFETKNSAYDYCSNYLKNIKPCLIVNVQILD